MSNVTVVVGGQYGSEAKGATVACLSQHLTSRDVVIRVAGPNAGHTAYDNQGREWKLRAVPVAAVVNPDCQLHIAAGSEIDVEVLLAEVNALESAGFRVWDRLTIHPSATILTAWHRSMEESNGIVGRIGSTGKGIGAARADRIMRTSSIVDDMHRTFSGHISPFGPFDTSAHGEIIIEGTQGYGLGLHTNNYPKVTSSDCRAIDFLAMAGISPWAMDIDKFRVLIVARCFPIRVAGNSGPMAGETTWDDLGLPEEHTTVTGKVRRVGAWDPELLGEAIHANGGGNWSSDVRLVLTMLDQKFPEAKGKTDWDDLSDPAQEWVREVEDTFLTNIALVGTSPTTMLEVEAP